VAVRVLGVDPGLGRCGWAVVEQGPGHAQALGYGTVVTRGDEVAPRLAQLAARLRAVVADHEPDSFAIERLFVNANVRTAMTVGQAAGVALLVAAEHGLTVATYTPSQVKRAVVGTGTAPKAQVGYMVRTLLGLEAPPTPADTADALAVALCHLHHAASAGWAGATPGGPGRAGNTRGSGDRVTPGGGPAVRGGLAAASAADWLARAAPTSPSSPSPPASPRRGP
jgi:crossover junction endodeoxyribonuclease RuvC